MGQILTQEEVDALLRGAIGKEKENGEKIDSGDVSAEGGLDNFDEAAVYNIVSDFKKESRGLVADARQKIDSKSSEGQTADLELSQVEGDTLEKADSLAADINKHLAKNEVLQGSDESKTERETLDKGKPDYFAYDANGDFDLDQTTKNALAEIGRKAKEAIGEKKEDVLPPITDDFSEKEPEEGLAGGKTIDEIFGLTLVAEQIKDLKFTLEEETVAFKDESKKEIEKMIDDLGIGLSEGEQIS